MPIRMTDDPRDQNQNDYDDDQGGGGRRSPGGGGGGLFSLLPLLMGLFKGKGILLLVALAAGAYFFLGKSNCNVAEIAQSLFSQSGYNFNPAEFDKASVYEGQEDDNTKNPLPEAVSLLRFAPQRGNQGKQGSCVAWSSAYADECQGSYIQLAMEQMSKQGALPLDQFPYSDQDCTRKPDGGQIQQASQFKIHGFTRLTNGDNVNSINVRALKEHLAKDAPVVIGMMVGQSFMQDMMGQESWQPQGMDASMAGMGGHAMCVIGYDDRKFGGAFQIMNSWGPEWGKDGVGWVKYGDFKNYVREAYGVDPLPKRGAAANIPLECTIGLVNNATKKNIRLRSAGANEFQTVSPIRVGTRFKMEIRNATECYIYIFGQDEFGKSLVLFPYMKQGETVSKHSPYCGITGYRLFPKSQSLEADSIGDKDYIAIVTSKEELDYNSLNRSISNNNQSTYASKVNGALESILIRQPNFSAGVNGSIYFKVNANNNKAVATIVAFDKTK